MWLAAKPAQTKHIHRLAAHQTPLQAQVQRIIDARHLHERRVHQRIEQATTVDLLRPRAPPPGTAPKLTWSTKLAKDVGRAGDPNARRQRELQERENGLCA